MRWVRFGWGVQVVGIVTPSPSNAEWLQVLAPGEGPLGPLGEEGLPSGAEEGPVRTMF